MGAYQSSNVKAYGWKPDLPDIRDKKIKFAKISKMKSKVDLRNFFDSVYDQKNIGSCTIGSICSIIRFDQIVKNIPSSKLSILFLYYNARDSNGLVKLDSGAGVRDTIKAANKLGVCDESLWVYNPSYYNIKPYSNCYNSTKLKGKLIYRRITNELNQLRMCLSANRPFIFGFSVYDSFEDPMAWSPKIDEMPYPNPNKEKLKGGNTAVAVGYSDKRKCFIVRNNWGPDWGLNGYFFMSYEFICSSMATDFWIIETKEGSEHRIDNEVIIENIDNSRVKNNNEHTIETKPSDNLENVQSDNVDQAIKEVMVVSTEISTLPVKPSGKCLIR
jgi:C1A family cysteine protease